MYDFRNASALPVTGFRGDSCCGSMAMLYGLCCLILSSCSEATIPIEPMNFAETATAGTTPAVAATTDSAREDRVFAGTSTQLADEKLPVAGTEQQGPQGEHWPQFRGPGGLGLASASNLPTTWSDTENIVWKTPLPGPGTSSPIILGDRLYLTYHDGYAISESNLGQMEDLQRFLACFNLADGQLLWSDSVLTRLPEAVYESRMHWHGYASSTPVADEDGVIAFFGKSGVLACDHAANRQWTASVGEGIHEWGSATSPVLFQNLVIINAYAESKALVALNRKTGEEVWRTGGLTESWNTPLLVELPDGSTELVLGDFGKILGFDPATGERLWSCQGPDWYVVGSLVAHAGVVYAVVGRQYEAIAVRAGGRGDVTPSHVVWRANKGSNVSSAIYYEGHLYFAHESQGIVYCLNAETGELMYERRVTQRGEEFYPSPIIADRKLIYVRRRGGTLVLPAAPRYEVLAYNTFESDRSIFNASPAALGQRLYLRSNQNLYCLGLPQ